MARTMAVHRADATVALVLVISAEELQQADPREDLTVYGIFPDPGKADSFAGSIRRAAQDAVDPDQRSEDGRADHGGDAPPGDDRGGV